jgi:hypothetical protein
MSYNEIKSNFNILMIKENIISIQNEINQMKSQGKTDSFDFEMSLLESHAEFYQEHPFLVKKLCKCEDITMLYKMLGNLDEIEKGSKSLSGVELKLGDELADEYLYPAINKK